MKPRLLHSVELLPTISEMHEEIAQGGCHNQNCSSQSLDDYVNSICQLAQPTSLSGYLVCSSHLNMEKSQKTNVINKPIAKHSSATDLQHVGTNDKDKFLSVCLDDVTFKISSHLEFNTQHLLNKRESMDWLFSHSHNKNSFKENVPSLWVF
ncbi:DEPP protein, partial [Polypterus senegalus]